MNKGFTLLELIVVVAVIAVLIGITIPVVGGIIEDAKQSKAHSELKTLAASCLSYQSKYGFLPYSGLGGGRTYYAYAVNNSQMNRLSYLTREWLSKRIITDPWSTNYRYHMYLYYNPPANGVVLSDRKSVV